MDTVAWVMLGAVLVLEILIILVLTRKGMYREFARELQDRMSRELQNLRLELSKDSADEQTRITQSLERSMQSLRMENEQKWDQIDLSIRRSFDAQREQMANQEDAQSAILQNMQKELLRQDHETQEMIMNRLVESIQTMTRVNSEKLAEIQADMREKLDRSLNERLDSSFDKIGQQLSLLYKTAGELQALSGGVESLNRTLSNVKSRGTWGEMQLGQILSNIFPEDLYIRNAQVKEGSQERVEYAIRIPDKTVDGRTILLPIDSKFPADIYQKIQVAAAAVDARAAEAAVNELKNRIRNEAKDICTKYINPPQTTDFAVLFVPTESLYSEILRISGLAESCQKDYKVLIAGPATISALLNSLAVGFRYLTVSRNTRQVLEVLENIRDQYAKFGDLIDRTQRNLDLAVRSTEDMKKRSDLIRKRLTGVNLLNSPGEQDFVSMPLPGMDLPDGT